MFAVRAGMSTWNANAIPSARDHEYWPQIVVGMYCDTKIQYFLLSVPLLRTRTQ